MRLIRCWQVRNTKNGGYLKGNMLIRRECLLLFCPSCWALCSELFQARSWSHGLSEHSHLWNCMSSLVDMGITCIGYNKVVQGRLTFLSVNIDNFIKFDMKYNRQPGSSAEVLMLVFLKECRWQTLLLLTECLFGVTFLPTMLAILFLKLLWEALTVSLLSGVTLSN